MNAARVARDALAQSLLRVPELGEMDWLSVGVTRAVGDLYAAEVYAKTKGLARSLESAVSHLGKTLGRAHVAPSPTSEIGELTAAIARALAVLHPAWSALARTERRESTEPFPLHGDRAERREGSRVALRADVGFESDTHFYTGVTGDLSDGGLFVATDELLSKGTKVTVSFVLPEGYQVVAEGRVAWVRQGGNGPKGMGIALAKLPSESILAIKAFMARREPTAV